MNAKISVFVICVEAIRYLLLYNWYDCTFNDCKISHDKLTHPLVCEAVTEGGTI